MRILKLILFTITLALACSVSYGQAPTKVAFGGTRPIDTAWAGRHLRIDSTVRFLKYSTADATKYLRINASGFLELGTPAGGGGNADSATFFTNYRADTMRSNIYTQLGLKGSGTVTNVSTGFGMLGGPITTTGTVRVDSNSVMTVARGYKVADSVAGLIPSVSGYVPYTGANQPLNLGTQNLITDTITGTGSGGLHLHGSASNSGIEIANFGQVRMDYYPIANSGDSVLTTNSQGFVQVYNLKGNYVPYTGATNNLDMGNYGVTAKRLNVDTLEPNSSAGLHLHNTSHQDIFIAGAGGGQNLTIYAPTSFSLMANQSETDTVLGSTSTGLVKKIGIATTYLKKSDSSLYVTQYRLADTAAAIRAAIPSVAGYATTAALADSVSGRVKYSDTVSLIGTQYQIDTTAFNALTRINTKGSGTVTSIQIVGGTGATVTPTTAVTTSGVYTVTPEVSSATYNTLSNKRITYRTSTAASYTTSVTISSDSVDMFVITAQAGALLFNQPSGTPTQGQMLLIRIKDNGTARALTWNSVFRSGTDVTLPTTTTISKTLYMEFLYNTTDSKWDIVGKADGY